MEVEEVATQLRLGVTRLYSRFRSERLEGEVPDAALLVLLALDRHDRMSLTALAEAAHVTLGSISQTARRLEEQEYVAKARDTADRRRVLFALTDEGRLAVTASRRHRRDWLNGRVAELTPDERAAVARVAPLLIRMADS
ncbi:MAG: MarR family transcriptional regulator [Propionicimonas sp.]|uniref:MarR family transcriptional regulator n=1 Tax=Propionicimonas sp. TaxID=1955623 RepID=UPI003D110DF1